MSFLSDLLNPPRVEGNENYKFDNDVHENLTALQYVMNPSILTNANFSTGGAVKTQADGDNAVFFTDWKVVGAGVATYTLTPVNYAANSLIQSASTTYEHSVVSGYTTSGLYFYQRQANTVRKYQKNYFTYGFLINNNQNKVIQIRMDIYSFYDPSSSLKKGKTIFLNPGSNKVSSTILTDSLDGISVGANPYTEFRFNFIDLGDGTADLNIYQIKCEFGTVSTLLQQ